VGNLVMMKRARDLLQQEMASQLQDLEALAGEVTSRKRELQASLETLRVALEHAERANQVKSSFLRLVSHELRTPLTSLQLQLQRLQRDGAALAPPQRETVDRMARSSARLLDLIESLLEYARIETGQLTIHREAFDLTALAAEVVEEILPQAQQKQLGLRLLPAPKLPPLESDRRLVRLILVNLVSNAIKFTAEGHVEVAVTCEDGAYRLAVTDTGPGIPPEQQALIFEPFEHLEPVPRKHTPGVGLGLALVKEMAGALGGSITLRSEAGSGSTFTVSLPAARP
jgi:signal transduction histidine kinase